MNKIVFGIVFLLIFCLEYSFAWHYEVDDAAYIPSDTYEKFSNPTLNGGVIYITKYGSLDVYTSTFANNSAKNGGAIYNDNGILDIQTNSVFELNYSTSTTGSKGGAIFNNSKNTTIGSNVKFNRNYSSYYGGAIFNSNSGTSISIGSNIHFNQNTSAGGGAIYNYGNINIGANSQFNQNYSTSNSNVNIFGGGAIYNYGNINIGANPQFNQNHSNSEGGAIRNFTYSTITFEDGVIFKNNVAIKEGGAINNWGTINLIANTNNVEFTGNTAKGISNAIYNSTVINLWASKNADIIFNDRITGYGSLYINSSTTTISSFGKIILNEDMKDFTGYVYLYAGEIELKKNARFFSGTIILSSGTLNIQNNSIDNNIVIDKLTSTNNVNLNIDVNLKNNTSDYFTINNANGSINLTSINILDISPTNDTGSICLFNLGNAPTINILATAYYNWTEYIFNNTTQAGILSWKKGDTKTFKEIVNINAPNKRSVSLASNEYVTENLGILGGTQLTIYGNAKNIIGNNVDGIYVGNGKILDIENVNNYSGFNSTYGAIKNEGTLNISGTNFSNNSEQDIINNGILNLINANSSFSKGITGTGNTIINNYLLNLNNAKINQENIKINVSGTLNSNASSILGNIVNNGRIIFNGGINGNKITGIGNLQILDNITNQANITQNNLEILANKQLKNSTATVEIDNLLITNNNSKIINDGILIVNSGTNNGDIEQTTNTSSISINGNFINNSTINQNVIRINKELINNSQVIAKDIYINGNFKLGENGTFFNTTNSTIYDGAKINLQNNKIQNHDFGNLTINSGIINLDIDADLENKVIDTISATNFSGNGKININNINVVNDIKKFDKSDENIDLYFADDNLKNIVISEIKTIHSALYNYSVNYDSSTGFFRFLKQTINPITFESVIANQVGAYITQVNIVESALNNIDSQMNIVRNSKNNRNLYASVSNVVFEEKNSIEQGLWLRPYAVSETIKVDDTDIKNDAYGTIGGLDLQIANNILASFYIGLVTSKQNYEEININQTGYVLGLTGSYIAESYYVALTANAILNKADAQNMFGTDNIENNSYTLAGKTGIDIKLSSKLTLQPNLLLMYSMINTADYINSQNNKITSESTTNLHIEPSFKLMLNLKNQFTPYAVLSMAFNNNSAKVTMNDIVLPEKEIGSYSDLGIGFEKNWTSWNMYLQGTGRFGARQGFGLFGGLKYKFGNSNDKISKQIKQKIKQDKKNTDFETEQLEKQLEQEQKELDEMEKEND